MKIFIEEKGGEFYPKIFTSAIGAPLNGMKTYNRIERVVKDGYSYDYQDPGIVMVLDPGNKRQLFEYNPWGIRLSEFTFLKKLRPTEFDVQTTLRKYIKIEKRFGK